MKKLFAVAIVLVLASGLYAQMMPHAGVKGGVNYGVLNPDIEGMDNWTGLGYNFGIEVGMKPMPMLALDLGFAYYIAKYSITEDEIETEATINSFYIPFDLRYMFMATPMMSPYVKAGAAMMMQQSGDVTVDDTEFEIPDEDLETDFYVLGGLGLDIMAMPTFSVRPDITFQYNLTADDDETEDASESGYDILFTVGFFYHF